METLNAHDIYSVQIDDYQDGFAVISEEKMEVITRCDDETDQDMRDAGYVSVENDYQFGKEMWISVDDLPTQV